MSRPHAMDSAACWCQPWLYTPCTECDVDYSGALTSLMKMPTDKGCWACVNGLRAIIPAEAQVVDRVVVVHNR